MEETEPKLRKKTGILTGDDIKDLNIIDSHFNESSLKIASYDFRLGDVCYEVAEDGKGVKRANLIRNNGVLIIEKFSSIIITSKETVKLPRNVVGRFDLRIKYALQGLILQVGPQLEPNSECPLYGLLLNFSDKRIYLSAGEELMTAEFSFIDIENLSDRFKKPSKPIPLQKLIDHNHFYGNLSTCFKAISNIDKDLKDDFQNLKSQCEEAEKKLMKNTKSQAMFMSIVYPIILTILLPLLCVFITKVSINKADYPYEDIVEIRKQYESIHKKVIQLEVTQTTDSIQPRLKTVESVDKNKLQDL